MIINAAIATTKPAIAILREWFIFTTSNFFDIIKTQTNDWGFRPTHYLRSFVMNSINPEINSVMAVIRLICSTVSFFFVCSSALHFFLLSLIDKSIITYIRIKAKI
ncbi:hypothetical protein ABUK63_10620 [Lactococcus lactis]|uniref:hypothetical protein n=1 Tax=Lactococcus lactis TaxID=1358 RepID=UPI003D2851B8